MAEQKKPEDIRAFGRSEPSRENASDQQGKTKQDHGEKTWQNQDFQFDEKPHVPHRSTGLCALASLLLVIACLFLIRFETNRIGSLKISAGNYVTEEQVAAVIGSVKGKYLPFLDTAEMEKEIREQSPMVADVRFDLSLTRRLKVSIIDEEYRYFYRTENGAILLLNEHFKALAYHPSDSCKKKDCPYEKGALTELYISAPEEITLGEILLFAQKEELASFAYELNEKKGSLYKKLNLLDIRNARHIVFIFDNLVCVELSESDDLQIKCLALEKMMVKRKTREEEIETRFTYVDPVNGTIYWAVEEWANLYEDYPNPDRP